MLYWLIAVASVLLDRVTKYWAVASLKPHPDGTVPLILDALHLTYTENRGAAFGMLQGFRPLFLAITAAAMGFIIWELWRKRRSLQPLYGVALGLVLGGAFGNFFDRLMMGYVVDFIDFRLINFAIFNVADSSVCIGAVLFAIFTFFTGRKSDAAL